MKSFEPDFQSRQAFSRIFSENCSIVETSQNINVYIFPTYPMMSNLTLCLQTFLRRNRSMRHQLELSEGPPGEGELSKTPEDSICSGEGPSGIFNDGPSAAYSDYGVGFSTPNIHHSRAASYRM